MVSRKGIALLAALERLEGDMKRIAGIFVLLAAGLAARAVAGEARFDLQVTAEPRAVPPGEGSMITVVATSEGRPVAGVEILLKSETGVFGLSARAASGTTDEEGTFRTVWRADVPSGMESPRVHALDYQATKPGLSPVTGRLLLHAAAIAEPAVPERRPLFVVARAEPAAVEAGTAARVTVVVREGTGRGSPVAGAKVEARADGGVFGGAEAAMVAGETDADGTVRLAWIAPSDVGFGGARFASLAIRASREGYLAGSSSLEIGVVSAMDRVPPATDARRPLFVRVTVRPEEVLPGGEATVAVEVRAGDPDAPFVAGARVQVTADGGRFLQRRGAVVGTALTDEHGVARLTWRTGPAEDYGPITKHGLRVVASAAGHADGVGQAEVLVRRTARPGPITPAGPLALAVSADPVRVPAGGRTKVTARVSLANGDPLGDAEVLVSAGGGSFEGGTGGSVAGRTGPDGTFPAVWKPLGADAYTGEMVYVLGVRASHPRYGAAQAEISVEVVAPVAQGPTLNPVTPIPIPSPQQSMSVSVVPDRASLPAGSTGWIVVRATGAGGGPVAGATVEVQASGGTFVVTGTPRIQGTTDAQGQFRAEWRTDAPATYRTARPHEFTAAASRTGFVRATGRGVLTVVPLDIR